MKRLLRLSALLLTLALVAAACGDEPAEDEGDGAQAAAPDEEQTRDRTDR